MDTLALGVRQVYTLSESVPFHHIQEARGP
jgi:hypothetical protein